MDRDTCTSQSEDAAVVVVDLTRSDSEEEEEEERNVANGNYIVSFDIGPKNSALCVMNVKSMKIIEWRLVGQQAACAMDSSIIADHYYALLSSLVIKYRNIRRVLVERQMRYAGSHTGKTAVFNSMIEVCLITCCKGLNIPSSIVKPLQVQTYFQIPTKANGKKARSIALAKLKIDELDLRENNQQYSFDVSEKKDDLADSLLQILYHIHK